MWSTSQLALQPTFLRVWLKPRISMAMVAHNQVDSLQPFHFTTELGVTCTLRVYYPPDRTYMYTVYTCTCTVCPAELTTWGVGLDFNRKRVWTRDEKFNSFPPNDTICCHHGHGLSISLWEVHVNGEFNTMHYTLVHDFCFV